ncbi:hypothetical protein FGB62_385g07 [Gracilaria domingensis]|nr:hypothetical protein FGB62_385g07 [Gracilaria domingensis]
MGSTLSTAASAAAQRSATRVTRPRPAAVTRSTTSVDPPSTRAAPITARVQEQHPAQQPSLYQRPTSADWAATLTKMSGAITTTQWDAAPRTEPRDAADKRHPAQRSAAAADRLPRLRSRAEHEAEAEGAGATRRPPGRLSQLDVLELFNLRREQLDRWDARALARRYNVAERDVADLLSFTRTYTARLDADGQLRGYYNADRDNTIRRFEKD